MKTMKRCVVPSILLMLSLVAAGRPSTSTAADDVGTILLPSEGIGQAGMMATRPWKCCDFALCTRSFPPMCRCMDKVEQCAATCEKCEPATSDSSQRVCNDWYHGFPGPMCTQPHWSFPPMCRCMDKVEQCAATCKKCEPATSDSSRRVCNDWYHGFPGAKCTAGGN
ncbi:Bowman-Birk type trypsin inhibitor-like [Triticum aestivum]|uniref:Bowman-Birk type trypsin inhibitor-like n=1 Tax=Triticum aestivum TaxID=4565 RepID=UPI001D021466|nr:Bowman-Birk type trypsin inhibitor-like [Triticum aestivum]